ncbi:MAG TPA: AIR synthase-related protein, partial [Phycisphaerales bacterium]|nr:AIR synthase-related protein [Phycisphaerales bacterium]
LRYEGTEVGRMSMEFLHEGVPMPTREAVWAGAGNSRDTKRGKQGANSSSPSVEQTLKALLAHPNIASKRCIIRQYDHEVQGRTVVHPLTLTQRGAEGPADAAVLQVLAEKNRGLAIGNGLATGLADDPYLMALAAVDECVRNLVCVGADPARIAILDNFCWPGCNDEVMMGLLVRAAHGCYDAAKAYRTPFISGKDSLNNQFTTEGGKTIRIPPTLLISGMGIVPDLMKCATMDAKQAGNLLVMVGMTHKAMGGSHYQMIHGTLPNSAEGELPTIDLESGPKTARAVHELIKRGLVRAAHDCSEGGMLVAAAEMAFAGELGLQIDLSTVRADEHLNQAAMCFSETPSRYLLEVERKNLAAADHVLRGLPYAVIGEFNRSDRMIVTGGVLNIRIEDLRTAWSGTLNW